MRHQIGHQQAADELGDDLLGGAGEEGFGEVLGGSWWREFYDSSAIPMARIATVITNVAVASDVPITAQILILCF